MSEPQPFPERVEGSASKVVNDTVLLAVKTVAPDSVVVVFQNRFTTPDGPLMCRVTGYIDEAGTQAYDLHWMPPEYEPTPGSVLEYAAVRAWVGAMAGEPLSREPGR